VRGRWGVIWVLVALVVTARPAHAVRLTTEVFLGDLNDVFFGAGETMVVVADPTTHAVTIDQASSSLTALGQPLDLGLAAVLDPVTGLYTGTGFIGAPQIGLVTTTDHADGDFREATAPGLPIDLWDGLGEGATVSIVQTNGCADGGSSGLRFGSAPERPRHFVECGISLFLTAFVMSEDFSDVDCTSAPDGARCEDGDACTAADLCQAGACVPGGPLDCDDGEPCTVDSCEPASGCIHVGGDQDVDSVCDDDDNCPLVPNLDQLDVDPADAIGDACECRSTAPGRCVLDGKGAAAGECATELMVEPTPDILASKNLPTTKLVCSDGSPCDRDGVADGTCRFAVALCLNNRDPRRACEQRGVDALTLRKPVRTSKRPHEADAADALLAAVSALAPSAREGARLETVRFSPLLEDFDRCTGYVDLDVPVKGKRGRLKLSLSTTAGPAPGGGTAVRDKDALKLYCQP